MIVCYLQARWWQSLLMKKGSVKGTMLSFSPDTTDARGTMQGQTSRLTNIFPPKVHRRVESFHGSLGNWEARLESEQLVDVQAPSTPSLWHDQAFNAVNFFWLFFLLPWELPTWLPTSFCYVSHLTIYFVGSPTYEVFSSGESSKRETLRHPREATTMDHQPDQICYRMWDGVKVNKEENGRSEIVCLRSGHSDLCSSWRSEGLEEFARGSSEWPWKHKGASLAAYEQRCGNLCLSLWGSAKTNCLSSSPSGFEPHGFF